MAAPTVGQWYRLTNAYTVEGLSLDVVNDAGASSAGTLQMAATGAYTGQSWQLQYNPSTSTSTYALFTQFLGENKRLDVYGDDATKPHLADAGGYSGQIWTITAWGDGTYRLSNSFSGSNLYLDVYSDTHVPFLEPLEHTGQHWTFTRLADAGNSTSPVSRPSTGSTGSSSSTANAAASATASSDSNPIGSSQGSNSADPTSKSSGSNTGAIVGGVIGGLAVLIILLGLLVYYRRRRKHADNTYNSTMTNAAYNAPVTQTPQIYQDGMDSVPVE